MDSQRLTTQITSESVSNGHMWFIRDFKELTVESDEDTTPFWLKLLIAFMAWPCIGLLIALLYGLMG